MEKRIRIKTGYLYHIKDEYFNKINDKNLMQNHERGKKRPTYFTIKDGKILWFIPVSSKVDKYKKIVNNKIKKYGFCNTIIIEKLFNDESVILLQNAFPTLEKYIEQEYKKAGISIKVPKAVKEEIDKKTRDIFAFTNRGVIATFTNLPEFINDIKNEYKKLKT